MSNVKNWPTFRIKAVLDDPYCRGIDGKDYEEIREELQYELWERENKAMEKTIKDGIKDIPVITKDVSFDDIEARQAANTQSPFEASDMSDPRNFPLDKRSIVIKEALELLAQSKIIESNDLLKNNDAFSCLDSLYDLKDEYDYINNLIDNEAF